MMQGSICSGATALPSMESEESVTLQSLDGQGLGFDVSANADGSFTVDNVRSDGVAATSGRIRPGDRLTDIGIDLSKLKSDDVPKLFDVIATFPVKYSVRKHGSRPANLDAGLKLDTPKYDIGFNGVKGDLAVPAGKQDIGFVGTGPFIASGPSVNLPDISVEVNRTSKGGGVDIDLPQVEIDHGGVEVTGGKTGSIGNKLKGFFSPGNGKKDKHGKGKGKIEADVSLPIVEFKSGKIGENIDASINPGDAKLSFEKPKIDIDVQEPSVERDLKVKAPKADRESWFDKHKPKISIGKSGKYSVSDASANTDTGASGLNGNTIEPKGDLRGNMEMKGRLPTVDIGVPHSSGKAGDNIQQPCSDITVTRPDIGTSIDANIGVPTVKMEAISIPGTTGNISVTTPSVDMTSPDIGLESSGASSIGGKIKGFFKRGDSKKKKTTPAEDSGAMKLELDANIPKVKLDVKTDLSPRQQGQLKAPEADFSTCTSSNSGNVEELGKDLQGKFHTEISGVQVDFDRSQLEDNKAKSEGGGGEGGVNVELPKFGIKGVSPKGAIDVGVKASHPSVEIEGTFDNPVIIDGQQAEVDSGIAKGKGNPELRGSAEAELPRVNDIKKSKSSGGNHFRLPRLSFKSKSPKADSKIGEKDLHGRQEGSGKGSMSSPNADINIESPTFDQSPQMKLDAKGLGGKMKGFFTGQGKKTGKTNGTVAIDVNVPEIDVTDAVQKIKPEGTAPGKIEGGIDSHHSDVDAKGKKPKASGRFGIKMPSFDSKGKGPRVDVDIGADASLSTGKIEEVDADIPDVELKGEKHTGSGGYGINLPSVDFKATSPKAGVEFGGKASLPSGNIEGEVDANLPDMKVKGEKPKESGGFGIELPSFDLKATSPKTDVDIGGDASLPCGKIEGTVDACLPDIKVKADKPKASGGIDITLPSYDLKGKDEKGHVELGADTSLPSPKLDVNLAKGSLDTNVVKRDRGLDISATGSGVVFSAEPLPGVNETQSVEAIGPATVYEASLAEQPKVNVSGLLESPSAETDRVEFNKSDKRSSFGRKVKGFFSSKDRSNSVKADVDVSLGVAGDRPAVGGAAGEANVSLPGVHADLRKGQDGERGFASSYDAGLHQEAAIDMPPPPPSPSMNIGGEAAAAAAAGSSSSPASSDNERSMLHDDKGQKFRVRLGSGKSSKSRTDGKRRLRIEEGLRRGLATELIASAGRVQIPEQKDKSHQSRPDSRTHDKIKASSQPEEA